jgi:hypothetical protein
MRAEIFILFQSCGFADLGSESAEVGVFFEADVALPSGWVFGLEFVQFEEDFVVLGAVGGGVDAVEPGLGVLAGGRGDVARDRDVGFEGLDLVWGEEQVGDGGGDEFCGGGDEGVAVAEGEPEGVGHGERLVYVLNEVLGDVWLRVVFLGDGFWFRL